MRDVKSAAIAAAAFVVMCGPVGAQNSISLNMSKINASGLSPDLSLNGFVPEAILTAGRLVPISQSSQPRFFKQGGASAQAGFSNEELALDDRWPDDDLESNRFDNAAHQAEDLSNLHRSQLMERLQDRVVFASNSLQSIEAQHNELGQAGHWWDKAIAEPFEDRPTVLGRLDDFVFSAVANSHQIKVFGDLPAIRETAIDEAEGRFTPELFAEARAERRNEFSSNIALTTGEDRLKRNELELEVGIRSRIRTGAEVTLAQRFTDIDTNETDFLPNNQVRSRTVLTVLQPLLRGSGTTINNAPTEVAKLDTEIARYEFWRQVEGHLLEVERAYWALYQARSEFMQMERLAKRTTSVASRLAARRDIDADPLLISRARAASAQRQADLVRARTAIVNSEARLKALVNDPELDLSRFELLPATLPGGARPNIGSDDLIAEVLTNRPEVQQAFLQHRASIIREGVAANESLPQLDLVLEGRFTGGAEDDRFGRSFGNGIEDGFGYLIGLRFSIPLGADERDARHTRRQIETRQQQRQIDVVLSTSFLDLETAINEYQVAIKDMKFAHRALHISDRDLGVLDARWRDGGYVDGGLALLAALLDSQLQVQQSERAVAAARASVEIASANLARARGGLLDRWGLNLLKAPGRRGLPTYRPVAK